ncbi:peptide chain release factor-like protein [Nitrospira defluvii]|nr:peptide chain release factor-like protein [Nitrospira defluvii]
MNTEDEMDETVSKKAGDKKSASLVETKPFSIDRLGLEKEVVIHTFRASGPGGQHRNVTDSGVRIVHKPSGLVVTATESRSQLRNKEKAFDRLIGRLQERNRIKKPRIPTKISRAARKRMLEEKHLIQKKKRLREKPDLED